MFSAIRFGSHVRRLQQIPWKLSSGRRRQRSTRRVHANIVNAVGLQSSSNAESVGKRREQSEYTVCVML